MKEQVIICDLCNGEMYDKSGAGHSLHIKNNVTISRIWWWQRSLESINKNLDICEACYSFIRGMVDGDTEIRKIYEMYHRMVPADMERFREQLLELVKETDRYYHNHPQPE